MSVERGKYIVIEGCKNTGKTTQAGRMAEILNGQVVSESGGTLIGDKITELLLDPAIPAGPRTELMLQTAGRAQLANDVIKPTLEKGAHVVSDCNWLSSAVHLGMLGISYDDVRIINHYVLGDLIEPDLVVVLKGDPRALASRSAQPATVDLELQAAIQDKYVEIGERVGAVVVEAVAAREAVTYEITNTVRKHVGLLREERYHNI